VIFRKYFLRNRLEYRACGESSHLNTVTSHKNIKSTCQELQYMYIWMSLITPMQCDIWL
jgi:hypothetical protein